MANKFVKLVLSASALLAGLAATACDDIEAEPDWEADYTSGTKILDVDGLTNNDLKKIYDALVKSGTSNSEKVLTQLLKELSIGYFGDFYTIKAAVDNNQVDAFVSSHPLYNDNIDKETDSNGAKRVKLYCEYLTKQINKEFVSIVKNSSYQERSYFKEEEWVKSIKENGYEVAENTVFKAQQLVSGEVDEDNVSKYFAEGYLNAYKNYIEESILPSLYQKKLVEYFIMKVNPGALGRTYARNVDYIKVSDNSSYPTSMKALTKAYANKVLEVEGKYSTYDFEFLNELIKGTVEYNDTVTVDSTTAQARKTMAEEIYTAAGFTAADKVEATIYGEKYEAYVQTTLGGYIKSYNKIKDSRFENDDTAYNDFTSNGTYTKEVGFIIKLNSLLAQATIAHEDDWYTSSTLSDVPSEFKNRLFKVKVASEINDTEVGTKSYGIKNATGYFITPETYEKTTELPYVYYTDSATYILKVNDAVSVSKLQKGNAETYASEKREEVAYETAHLISDNETYIKNAKQYFVEKAALAFHDDYVYDYFADTFPDLFDSNED